MILFKTETGLQVLKDRSVRLTPRQRSAFILIDGKRSVAEVLQASQCDQDDVETLLELGLVGRAATASLEAASVPAAAASGGGPLQADTAAVEAVAGGRSAQERYQAAYPIATQLTAGLGLRGFRLNLAVEGAGSCEQLTALLPKIRDAVGPDKVAPLERALAA